MAETLTYDPGTNDVTTIENLTPEEQDSLQVGEKIVAEQEQLLAGKYKDAESLEKAYVALQQKLGNKTEAEVEPETETEPETEATKDATDEKESDDPRQEAAKDVNYEFLDKVWEEAKGDWTDETLDQLQKTPPTELVNMHLAYRANVARNYQQKEDLTEEQSVQLKNIVGGEQQYNNMLDWSQNNLNQTEIDMFNQVMDKGDPLACFFAVRALSYRYEDGTGMDGETLTGQAPKQQEGFRSQQEVVAAMSDPRYENDPAYRHDIMQKLDRSKNVSF